MMIRILIVPILLFFIFAAYPARGEESLSCETLLKQQQDAFLLLQNENTSLQEKIDTLQESPHIGNDALILKSYRRLREIGGDIKTQRQSMADFSTFVTWMTTNLSGYSKYIEAGSFAAGFARVLPIPYAGQASVLTKFISQGVLTLNSASVAISRYLSTSGQFLSMVDALDQVPADSKAGKIATAARFADERLLKDMNEVRTRLAATAEISSSTLSFLESLNHYAGCTDEYWNKTKSFITRKEADRKEKSYLSQSILNLKNRAGNFNGKLKLFEESAKKDAPLIKSLETYDELMREMTAMAAKAKDRTP